MKSLLKWFLKWFVTKEAIREAIRAGNKALADSAKLDGNKKKIMEWGADASATSRCYLEAFADDGRILPGELEAINKQCDAMVDKYIPDNKTVARIVDAIIK